MIIGYNITKVLQAAMMTLLVLCSGAAWAQLSPGKLTKAHSKLEGLANCTQCHSIGAKLSEQKCLDCHKELKARISAKKGYHVSSAVKGKECITCHSEHHGLNFDMVRFDKKTFDHKLTGYELKGGHKISDCAKCHKPDNIASATLKKKPETFLGLETKCMSCHEDYHQKTMSSDCASCHNFTKFKPASLFNHAKTEFPLLGAHKTVDCASCHKVEMRNGKEFQKFAVASFKNCSNCHNDVHKGEFGTQCKACHNEESFHKITAGPGFNHNVTGFNLVGRHQKIDCKACHEKSFGLGGHFKEFKSKDANDCRTCHKDVHDGKFGSKCLDCHNQNSFKSGKTPQLDNFDHSSTGFALLGKHQKVDCRTCHKQDLTTPMAHDQCASCHKDHHEGDFATKKDRYPDCASCHNEQGFMPSTFTIEQHEKSSFVLDGAHVATPCNACHWKENKWEFNIPQQECKSCHEDIHKNFMDEKYYGQNSCKTCHNTDSWLAGNFDHSLTEWALEGKHATISCGQCHMDKKSGTRIQRFRDLDGQCVTCHDNIHGTQFEVEGKTDCSRCHGFKEWKADKFDHNLTQFKLEGEHKEVACIKCHKETMVEGKKTVNYKIEKFACADCHQ